MSSAKISSQVWCLAKVTWVAWATLLGAACEETPRTEVLIEITYDHETVFDHLTLRAYDLQDLSLDATMVFVEEPEVTQPRPTILVTLPDAWADKKVHFGVEASRDGSVVGSGGRSVLVARHRRTELLLDLVPGPPRCGDMIRQAAEACDGTQIPADACENELALGGEALCRNCRLDLSRCHICGNSAIEADEECDGNDFGAKASCQDAGFSAGVLGCRADCTLDTSRCFGGCGDGVLQGSEACDGQELGGATCASATGGTRPDGALGCGPGCALDISGCSYCGNGLLEGDEGCDSAAFGGLHCGSFGLGDGELRCTYLCTIDTTGCCGDGVRGRFEACDGADVGPYTCQTLAGVPDGQLGCTADCLLDVSGCHDCGNGTIDGPEECDGGSLGGATCASLGQPPRGPLSCAPDCTYDVSQCNSCGDGTPDAWEACDDGNTTGGDGCSADCQSDESCPNGVVDMLVGEACDDGNTAPDDGCSPTCAVEAGWHCAGSPSVCIPDTCGNGLIDQYEVCDGANLVGETCLSRGYRQGGGTGLACLATCLGYDLSGCSGLPIDSVAQVEGAIADAHSLGSHQRIAIHGGTYNLSSSILIDECGGVACTGGRPFGVTLEPLDDGQVCFTAPGAFPVFNVVTGENVIRDFCFQNVAQAVWIGAGVDAGGNTVLRNRITNASTVPDELIRVFSASNAILANRITSSLLGAVAIHVHAEGNTVAMNLVTGSFTWSITMTGFPSPTLPSRVDHNSLWIQGGLAGGGMRLDNAGLLCYRNNIVQGDGTSTGLRMFSAGFGISGDCGGTVAEKNVNRGHAVRCTGATDCPVFCDGTDPTRDLCDLDVDPGWTNADLCLTPGTNPLIDAALVPFSGAYDHDDLGPGNFLGLAPDIGARESGTTRRFGGLDSPCP